MLSQVKHLILVMPVTNASSERSFSALRRVKNYLWSSMNQELVNYLMLMHIPDLRILLNEFISSVHRSNIFAKY